MAFAFAPGEAENSLPINVLPLASAAAVAWRWKTVAPRREGGV